MATPTIALHSHSFTPQLADGRISLEEVARFYRGLGVDVIELADAHVRAVGPERVRALVGELEMSVVCYDVEADFVSNDAGARARALEALRAGIERAGTVGSRHVLTYPGRPRPDVEPQDVRRWFAEALRSVLPLAAARGVVVTIPDVGIAAELCGTSAHMLEIIRQTGPDLRMTYDVGNFLLAGEDPESALEALKDHIAHVHLKDWRVYAPGRRHPPGTYRGLDGKHYLGAALGDADLHDLVPRVIARLRELGYAGCLSIEYEGTGDPARAMRRGLRHLRELLS